MQKERFEGTRGSWESLASGCIGPYSPIGGLSALQSVTPSLAIAVPKVEWLNPRGFPQELSGIRNELYRSSGKLFPLYWEINVTILSTGREKYFPYLVIRLSRKCSQGRI